MNQYMKLALQGVASVALHVGLAIMQEKTNNTALGIAATLSKAKRG